MKIEIIDPKYDIIYGESNKYSYNHQKRDILYTTFRILFIDREEVEDSYFLYTTRGTSFNKEGDCALRVSEAEIEECHTSNEAMPIKRFFKSHNIKCDILMDTQQDLANIFVEKLNPKTELIISSLIPRFFPALFAEFPLTPWEIEFLKCAASGDLNKFIEMANERASAIDLVEIKLRGFLEQGAKKRKERIEHKIGGLIDDRKILLNDLAEVTKAIKYEQEVLAISGLSELKVTQRESEIMDYIKTNKRIVDVFAKNENLVITVATYLSSFDPEMAETIVNNKNSLLYEGVQRPKDVELVFRALLLAESKHNIKLRLAAEINIDINNSRVDRATNKYETYSTLLKTHMANPHIMGVNCFGGNEILINEAFFRDDFVSVLDICCAATGNLNVSDVMTSHLVEDILQKQDTKVFEIDGELASFNEIVKILKEEMEEDE